MSSSFQPAMAIATPRNKMDGTEYRSPRSESRDERHYRISYEERDPVNSHPSISIIKDNNNKYRRDTPSRERVNSVELFDHLPCSGSLTSPNSIIEDNFNDISGNCSTGDSSTDSKNTSIDRAKEILLRITCQEPLTSTGLSPPEEASTKQPKPQLPTKKPSLRKIHTELQHRFVSDLQTILQTKNLLLQQTMDQNEELKRSVASLNKEIATATTELKKMPRVRLHLNLVERVNMKLQDIIAAKNDLLKEAEEDQKEMRNELQEARMDMKQVENDKGSLVKELRRRGECEKELRATNCLVKSLRRELESVKERHKQEMRESQYMNEETVLNLQVQVRAMKMKYGQNTNDLYDGPKPLDRHELKAMVQIKEESIVALRNQVLASESTRRKLHNVIQELRGNIRVFVRVRPFLENECQTNRKRQIVTPINVVEAGNALTIYGKHENATYEFDKVYGPTSSQEDVFEELSDFVQSALDGYSACIFAYGQTGSGKTHTMQGEGVGDMRGITPRAVEQILKAGNLMKHTWNFYVQANFVEIYNEKLVDLLGGIKEEIEFFNSCEDEMLTLNPGVNKGSEKLTLRKDVLGQTFVEGLTNVMIDINDLAKGMAMINSILKCAARARTVAATKMNDRSSRSHSVFTLDIAGKNIQSGAVTAGSLHLVDLAGSERLDALEQDRNPKQLKETTNINKSLSCLGDVFSALASDASHIPYRNSKLTYLLQNCLGGDGKACMVVNLSPTMASCNESMQSLRFAKRVSQIEMGRGTKKVHFSK